MRGKKRGGGGFKGVVFGYWEKYELGHKLEMICKGLIWDRRLNLLVIEWERIWNREKKRTSISNIETLYTMRHLKNSTAVN